MVDSRIISWKGYVNYLPGNCNMTPLEYLMGGTVKLKCYAEKQETINYLKANICDAMMRDTTPYTWKIARKLVRSNEVLLGQPRQPYEWSDIPFLTGTIVLPNRKQ